MRQGVYEGHLSMRQHLGGGQQNRRLCALIRRRHLQPLAAASQEEERLRQTLGVFFLSFQKPLELFFPKSNQLYPYSTMQMVMVSPHSEMLQVIPHNQHASQ